MCILGRDEIIKMVEKYKVIHPFDLNLLDGDSYILTVREDVTLNYLEHKNVVSEQIVFVPPNCVGHMTAKSKYGRAGLSFLNAAKAHSGFVGRIVLEVVNLSNERKPITIKRGDPFMHFEFITRVGEAYPYKGEYQFQYMSEEEIEMYIKIMKNNWPNVFDDDYWRNLKKLGLNLIL